MIDDIRTEDRNKLPAHYLLIYNSIDMYSNCINATSFSGWSCLKTKSHVYEYFTQYITFIVFHCMHLQMFLSKANYNKCIMHTKQHVSVF